MNYFDIKNFKSHFPTNFICKDIIYFKTIDSTNNYANLIEKKFLECSGAANLANLINLEKIKDLNGTLIISEEQTSGRGRGKNTWTSNKGGLWFTLILKISKKVNNEIKNNVNLINLIMATSIYETLEKETTQKFKIKWPNDILYEDKKICGILSERNPINENESFINIGVGININNDISALNNKILTQNNKINGLPLKNATSLKTILKKEVEREKILLNILINFNNNYEFYLETNNLKALLKNINYTFLI